MQNEDECSQFFLVPAWSIYAQKSMFKTAANVKLHPSIKGEREKTHKSFIVVGVSLWCFCEEGREGLCFPHLFIFRGGKKKKGKRKKLTRSCITGKLHSAWVTGYTVMKVPRDRSWAIGWERVLGCILKALPVFLIFVFCNIRLFSSTAWWASGTKGAFVKYSTSLALSSKRQELPAIISRDSQEILNKTRQKTRLDIVCSSNSRKHITKKATGLAIYPSKPKCVWFDYFPLKNEV